MAVLGGGRLVIPAAGTQKNLGQGTGDVTPGAVLARVSVSPLPANTTVVYVGGPNTKATLGSENGIALVPTAAPFAFFTDDLSDIWVDARTNGEGVSFSYTTER
jgi:hypothetical protein